MSNAPLYRPVIVVGICGGSASGKSVLSDFIVKGLKGDAAVFCQDWYYKDNGGLSKRAAEKLNFDHPGAIEFPFLLRQLDQLRSGQAIDAPIYDYATHSRLKRTRRVEPRSVILVDGIFILQNRSLRSRLDASVYIEVPDDERLLRRVRRDVSDRRVDLGETLRIYESFVRPMHEKFVRPSARHATFRWHQMEDGRFRGELLREIKVRLKKRKDESAAG